MIDVAGYLAPMPGGVGLMTRAMLLTNVVELAESSAGGACLSGRLSYWPHTSTLRRGVRHERVRD